MLRFKCLMICVFSCRMHALLCDCSPLNAFFPLLESKHEEGERKRAREREKESPPSLPSTGLRSQREKPPPSVASIYFTTSEQAAHVLCVSQLRPWIMSGSHHHAGGGGDCQPTQLPQQHNSSLVLVSGGRRRGGVSMSQLTRVL